MLLDRVEALEASRGYDGPFAAWLGQQGLYRKKVAESLTEMLNLTENIVKAAVSPALPASYGALLLTQPADWIRRWWRRRPLTILFRLDSKLPRLSEYQQLVAKLWGEQAASRVLDQAIDHVPRLPALTADASQPDGQGRG